MMLLCVFIVVLYKRGLLKMEWKNIYRGLIMGATDLVPGISGGTIAVLLGIYDRLIAAINGLFSRDWRNHLSFIIPLGIGVAASILLLSRVINWMLANHLVPTYFFFLGLIIGVLPLLFREADAKTTFRLPHIGLLVLGIIAIGSLAFINNPDQSAVIINKTLSTYILLFFSGVLASIALILPGISGSLVFLIIGVYPTIIAAVSNFEFVTLLVTGIGILIGIISASKVVHFFLRNYRNATFSVIIGAVIGSIYVIFPGWPLEIVTLILSITMFSAGLFGAYLLGKIEY